MNGMERRDAEAQGDLRCTVTTVTIVTITVNVKCFFNPGQKKEIHLLKLYIIYIYI